MFQIKFINKINSISAIPVIYIYIYVWNNIQLKILGYTRIRDTLHKITVRYKRKREAVTATRRHQQRKWRGKELFLVALGKGDGRNSYSFNLLSRNAEFRMPHMPREKFCRYECHLPRRNRCNDRGDSRRCHFRRSIQSSRFRFAEGGRRGTELWASHTPRV